ncbi:DUF421 domain-containing protein [Botrimarina mediterranea]|uniref:DUF421 domain-containing protein n=1 Tax=Botrimarina mediterranea TaxID=2528022 RepID=A0A518KC09_9BACT|nr:YetF domain-containing protein [Botrimarina mediterranea]QDV75308.1 hypothetical protein Spa11_35220 [Botrimarina mediterranea]QDV79977.1 hypothetical protein K2D_35970 [Planctomycetes bacterium K2D]
MEDAFFDSWDGLLRTLAVGVLAYIALVALLRLSGKRTLTKLNAFDLVVTVALGSTLATMLLSKDVALTEGALALALLIGLQYLVTWTSIRLRWFRALIRSEPTLLLHHGRMMSRAMQRERITEGEVLAALRAAGVASVDGVEAVILETDGSLSVVQGPVANVATSLRDVRSIGNRSAG